MLSSQSPIDVTRKTPKPQPIFPRSEGVIATGMVGA
jgi:hypothetical protein